MESIWSIDVNNIRISENIKWSSWVDRILNVSLNSTEVIRKLFIV